MNDRLIQYYRCPERYVRLAPKEPPIAAEGYFRFGPGATCYGRYHADRVAKSSADNLFDGRRDVEVKDGTTYLPFDPSQVVDNLRRETYVRNWRRSQPLSALAQLYYLLRPLLSVRVRRHLQRFHLRGWETLTFPRWPVDCSVDNLLEQLLLLSLRSSGAQRIPFIWFWPDGASSCAIMTHDVETSVGRDFCSTLMEIDDSFGIKASFQIIPEERYSVSRQFLHSIRERGFEVVIHDLNHDGHLYKSREQFLQRAAKINTYGREYRAAGFRAGVLYRKQLWYDALEFSYDMSVPNVAHLDPQHGGCCTVMPYFVGNILELPVTAVQDYTLFNILGDYSTNLWKKQIRIITEKHGLMSFIVHPDYVMKPRESRIYEALLRELQCLKEQKGVWITIPGEVNRWWRQRAELTVVGDGDDWRIEGPGKERARVAYASEKEGRLVLSLQNQANHELLSVTQL
jgi:hypothetical protein